MAIEKYYVHVDKISWLRKRKLIKLGAEIEGIYKTIAVYAIRIEEDQLDKIRKQRFVNDVERQGPEVQIVGSNLEGKV